MKLIIPDWIVNKYKLKESDKLKVLVDYENKKIKLIEVIKNA